MKINIDKEIRGEIQPDAFGRVSFSNRKVEK